ncbi:uncharacterized protein LOC102787905 [Neolamprologus brichardi]|uniref:uncharacterized protein LOC102787905 n=1 Tax=Neolamprologus brichardi TaxID=32507 RepID=UPI0003EC2D98|nr:uncharacterized protein LOC102787905 [Neolamprologus brichardi]
MKFWSMRVSQVLQLSTLLVGLHHVWCSPALGQVPVSQVKMLSLGLAHLLEEVTENVERLEQHGEMMGREMDGATKRLESLRKKNIQVGRTHKQVRKVLQTLSARRDRQWRTVRDLQKESEDLETEKAAMQRRMNRILQSMRSLTEARSGGGACTGISSMKVLVDKQARRLASLTSEVSAWERMIDRRQQYIEHLEKQLSSDA